MQVKSIAECSKGSILQYFWPALSYYLTLRSVLSIFECPFYTGFTVTNSQQKYKSVYEIAVLISMVTSEGADYPAHLHSPAKAFIVHADKHVDLIRVQNKKTRSLA